MTQLHGPVLVVGAGLLGASLGLALRRRGIEVRLSDVDPRNLSIASGMGAGVPDEMPPTGSDTVSVPPQLVVVAVPPDHLADEIARALSRHPVAVVTDVGSVKAAPLRAVSASVDGDELARYVGSHPMAGSERSGPFAASATLFDGRPWAVTAHPAAAPEAVDVVTALAVACGASPVPMTPQEHDEAVARTSHLPHLLAALVAGRLLEAPAEHLALSGQGLRDVTRIAAGDPGLWQQIVAGNGAALTALLNALRQDLDELIGAVGAGDRAGVSTVLERGVRGTAVIPGKHGGPARPMASVYVTVPDHPGELARLLGEAGEAGVNVEDLHIDHDPGREFGLVELLVAEDRAEHLCEALAERGWATHR